LNLDFDTGSADLWVFSTELSSSASSGHTSYNPSKSSTANELQGYTWNITYGDGSSSSGNVYTDTVTVGGVSVTGQAVELAEEISEQFIEDTDSDGLLGLAFSSINTVEPNHQTTFFDTAISEGVLAANVFTADLVAGAPGSYDFGFIDASKYTGSIAYTDIDTSNGFWEFTGTGYAIGTASFKSSSIDAIADTGTTLILLDDSIVDAYYKKVSGASYDDSQGGYVFSCSATLPSFTLGIGSYHAIIPGTYMNYAPTDDSGSTCYGGIQSNEGIGFSIFGDVFLKSQFVVFDSDNKQLGVAAKTLSTK
jgi:aspergillopepsin I